MKGISFRQATCVRGWYCYQYYYIILIMMNCLHANGGLESRYKLRLVVALAAALSFLLYRFMYHAASPVCLRDAWHDLTLPLNQRLSNGSGGDNVVIGIGQVLMDGWIFTIGSLWIVKMRNGRVALAAIMLFLFRQVMMFEVAFPFPEHWLWHSPGFFSFTVPYDRTRDFFYSGHTGSLSVIMIELFTVSYNRVGLAVLVSLLFMMNMLTILEVHYTVDVAAGLVFAFFFHRLAGKVVYYWDWVLNLPYLLVNKGIQRYRRKAIVETNLTQNKTGSNMMEERLLRG